MKRLLLIPFVGVAVVMAIVSKGRGTRSVVPEDPAMTRARSGFDPAQSVALFVGARTFNDDSSLEKVPYAVDDAVDLAYTFALDPRVALVQPKRVVLALSDEAPRKEMSKRRLAELRRRGAVVAPATHSQILKLLAQQAGTVGAGGIFIVSFASHGFSEDGAQYLLASNSLFQERNTAIPAARIFDLVSKSDASRSLILIDACRERVRKHRSGPAEGLSAAPLIRRMGLTEGQVVLYAAAAGKWAYDDDARQNGVFTSAVLEGLQCRTGNDRSGMVTVDALSATVERRVLTWIRTNRDPLIRNATQASIDGAARMMPLAVCSNPPPSDLPPPEPEVAGPSAPLPSVGRPSLQPFLETCRRNGTSLLELYDSQSADHFVTTYIGWRDGCVSVLRDLDDRLPQRAAQETETNRFLSTANFWCATRCPESLSPGNCALFQETARAERCLWDLDNAVKHIDDVLIRNAVVLQPRDVQQGVQQ
ncbi:MAG TPA: caspase family protein [Thermoanaerobaculia bacterium]